MTVADKARRFADLHVAGRPLVLYNAWDAGSAGAIAAGGALAIATGSLSVAGAQGYPDGEALPLDTLLAIVARIAASVDLPVTVDFEGGYAEAPEAAAANVARAIAAGAVGINFEDRKVGGTGLHATDRQASRIRAIREAAEAAGVPLFINARTDLFLQHRQDPSRHAGLLGEALERAAAYAEAGASGFFVPALLDEDLLGQVCRTVRLPVNALLFPDAPAPRRLAELGIARISHGPFPYRHAMAALQDAARAAHAALG